MVEWLEQKLVVDLDVVMVFQMAVQLVVPLDYNLVGPMAMN